jgi:hypothetical protein
MALAGRPASALTRRDVARALLSVPSADALAALPGLRRELVAAGNPLTAAFWGSAETVLGKIKDATATIGDVRAWLEATGTEPTAIIGLHVWDEEEERSPVQAQLHGLLVSYLEERLADGETDPDRMAAGDGAAQRAYVNLQERWMISPLPDGRVPMHALLDEQDEEFSAAWDEVEAEALSELATVLGEVGARPVPAGELDTAARTIRLALSEPGWPGVLLAACGGVDPEKLPGDNAELWLMLAVGVVSPKDELPPGTDPDPDTDAAHPGGAQSLPPGTPRTPMALDPPDMDSDSRAMADICAIQHFDWLAAISALIRGGPGTPASEADIARYVSEYEPDSDAEEDTGDDSDAAFGDFGEDIDPDAVEGLFLHVTALWRVLGAIDDDDRLTALGWWGLPEALRRAWTPRS